MQDVSDVPLTEEEENWVRLSFLLIDEGTEWVKQIVQDFLHQNSLELKMFLDSNRQKLEYNCKHNFDDDSSAQGPNAKGRRQKKSKTNLVTRQFNAKPLTYEQFKVLFPDEPKVVSLDNCDLTLLILVSGILILRTPPDFEWHSKTVPDSNVDQASDLKRMRMMRNHLYAHIVECAIPTPEFEKHWDQLVEILTRLGATVEELDKIKLREVTKEERKRCAKRITTLFRGDMLDADEFAQKKMKEMAANHKPNSPQPKKSKQTLAKCHTEVLSVVEHHDDADASWCQRSNMKTRKVLFACEECCRFSTQQPTIPDHQTPSWLKNHCAECKGEIFM